jgi:hypothetical protein
MEHIYKINPSAGYMRNNRSRKSVKRKDNVLPLAVDNFAILPKLGNAIKKGYEAVDKGAGKVVTVLVGEKTASKIANPQNFGDRLAGLGAAAKIAVPIGLAVGGIAGAASASKAGTTTLSTANTLTKALTTSPAKAATALANQSPEQWVYQPVSTDPSTLPKTQQSVAAEKIAALNVADTSIGDTIKSNPFLLYGLIGFAALIFLIVVIKLK